jgi:hypothetical protein
LLLLHGTCSGRVRCSSYSSVSAWKQQIKWKIKKYLYVPTDIDIYALLHYQLIVVL